MDTQYTTLDLLMVPVYANLIKAKRKTLEQVPEKIRGLVKDELIKRGLYIEPDAIPETEPTGEE